MGCVRSTVTAGEPEYRYRNVAIWPRVTCCSGEKVELDVPVVIPTFTIHPTGVICHEATTSVNVTDSAEAPQATLRDDGGTQPPLPV